MFALRVLVAGLLILGATGCACRVKGGRGNIPVATEGGPLADVRFGFDSASLDADSKAKIASNAEWLKDNSYADVQIEGHADERGTSEYNMALGAKRASVVADALKAEGVKADRISTISYGEELPLDPRHNEEAWARNRRAHHNIK